MGVDLFPLGVATGEAFCNRVSECVRLRNNFKTTKHTLLASPRRYGKTSLALKALDESGLSYSVIDLFVSANEKMVEDSILRGIERLMNQIISKPEMALRAAKDILKNIHVILRGPGMAIEIASKTKNVSKNIMDVLQGLENLLKKQKKKAVLFIDEFQQIGQLPGGKTIEGAIRHVAQISKQLIFIFSGSNRHLLAHMFNDRSRPLYLLCDRLEIDRISSKDYQGYLNKAAKKTWRNKLSHSIIDAILSITARHPYYVNMLCSRLWTRKERPTIQRINLTWQEYVNEEKSRVAYDLNTLSLNQRKMLIALAKYPNNELTSQKFLAQIDLSSSSAIQALRILESKGYIRKIDHGKYEILDPLVKTALTMETT